MILYKKNFGQHIMIDANIRSIMANAANITNTSVVYEIGAGTGLLTNTILSRKPCMLIAIEYERDIFYKLLQKLGLFFYTKSNCCLPIINHYINNTQLLLLYQDACKILPLVKDAIICANLPYNIATHLLLQWLPYIKNFNNIVITIQKEVADRLMAECSSHNYSALSVIFQCYTNIECVAHIKSESFYPRPKVQSSVIKLTAKNKQDQYNELFIKIVHQAFRHRRKYLAYNLQNIITKEELLQLNIQPTNRAEQLFVSDYQRIVSYLTDKDLSYQ